ncbi:hypothetical protein [Embleya sp. NBC_00896]|uniref:hypothetical protein n=1 Tax=Embleya sp. NBC_00896 TaxID=2975961 RepID=UPI00386C1069|nr:hypothetical protein OG928_06275 [Embleya sp. NBC_00896]
MDGTSIAHLVSSLAVLPRNVKVLVTAKPDRRIRELFPDNTRTFDFGAEWARVRGYEDVAEYVKRRARSYAGARGTSSADRLESQITVAADSNFQYARHVLDELESGNIIPAAGGLPRGLPALYRAYLQQLIPHAGSYGQGDSILANHLPLLGLLAVARSPLPLQTTADILRTPAANVMTRVDELQQLIDFGSSGEPALRFFHESMADFIAVPFLPDRSPNPFHSAPEDTHAATARSYLDRFADGSWSACDDYGLAYLAEHVRRGIGTRRGLGSDELYTLALDPAYRDAQIASGRTDGMLRTANAALDHAVERGDFDALHRLIDAFAGTEQPQLQGVAAAALARTYPTSGPKAILGFLASPDSSARHVGLNAVYQLGFSAANLMRALALADDPDHPRMAAYMAYLKFAQGDHEIVRAFLKEIADGIRLWAPFDARRRLRFLSDVTIILYIHRVHDAELIAWGDQLWWEILTKRLHMRIANHDLVAGLLISTAAKTLSQRVGEAAMVDVMQSPDAYFRGGPKPRQLLSDAIELLAPDSDLKSSYGLLCELLESDVAFLRVIGAIALASHARRSLESLEPFLRARFPDLTPRARLWHLIAFGVLSPTRTDWRPFVAWQTAFVLRNDARTVITRDDGALRNLNVMLLPLGFACGKADQPMSEVEIALGQARETQDSDLEAALIDGLAMVGLYYPRQALSALRSIPFRPTDKTLHSFVDALATMRVLHPRIVDLFLAENGHGHLRGEVSARSNVARIRRSMDQVGYFNSAIYQVAHTPVMRERLTIPALRYLVTSESIEDFIVGYTTTLLNLVREYDYHLGAWAVEEEPS